mgnify:CR=1 FL=1
MPLIISPELRHRFNAGPRTAIVLYSVDEGKERTELTRGWMTSYRFAVEGELDEPVEVTPGIWSRAKFSETVIDQVSFTLAKHKGPSNHVVVLPDGRVEWSVSPTGMLADVLVIGIYPFVEVIEGSYEPQPRSDWFTVVPAPLKAGFGQDAVIHIARSGDYRIEPCGICEGKTAPRDEDDAVSGIGGLFDNSFSGHLYTAVRTLPDIKPTQVFTLLAGEGERLPDLIEWRAEEDGSQVRVMVVHGATNANASMVARLLRLFPRIEGVVLECDGRGMDDGFLQESLCKALKACESLRFVDARQHLAPLDAAKWRDAVGENVAVYLDPESVPLE